MRGAAIFALLVPVGGCVAVWGSSYHIEEQSADSVTIRYDAVLIDSGDVQAHANESCGRYQKVAVPIRQRLGVVIPGGSIAEIIFACDTQADARSAQRTGLKDATLAFSPMPTPTPYLPAAQSLPSVLDTQPPSAPGPSPLPGIDTQQTRPVTWGQTPYAPMIAPAMRDQPVNSINPAVTPIAR